MSDLFKIAPVASCAAGAHLSSIYSMNLGAVSFAQIVKAAEPAFAALLGVTLYGKSISKAKWLCLIPVIGGVCLASIKELDFSFLALFAACVANLFAAFRSNENKKLMETPGIRERLGGVGNQFALTTILAFLISLPFLVAKEGAKFGEFVELFKTNGVVSSNLITSGLYFYLYNELATLTIKKTSATTQSVANTAKRVIVIVGSALAFGESLEAMKMLGCFICIGGVFAYSLVPRRSSNTPALSPTTTSDPTPKRATCSRVRAPLWAGQVEAPRPSRAAPRGRRAARTGVICGALAHAVESAQESTSGLGISRRLARY